MRSVGEYVRRLHDEHGVELQALGGCGGHDAGQPRRPDRHTGAGPLGLRIGEIFDGSSQFVLVELHRPWLHPRRAHRFRRGDLGGGVGEHRGGDGHDLGRGAVVDRQAAVHPAPRDVRLQCGIPGSHAGGRAALGEVTDDGERAARAAPHQDAPVHLGEFLCLVDDHVPVGPVAVGCGAVGEVAGVAFEEAFGEVLGADDVAGQ